MEIQKYLPEFIKQIPTHMVICDTFFKSGTLF